MERDACSIINFSKVSDCLAEVIGFEVSRWHFLCEEWQWEKGAMSILGRGDNIILGMDGSFDSWYNIYMVLILNKWEVNLRNKSKLNAADMIEKKYL